MTHPPEPIPDCPKCNAAVQELPTPGSCTCTHACPSCGWHYVLEDEPEPIPDLEHARDFDALIEQSSLGTPEAKQARATGRLALAELTIPDLDDDIQPGGCPRCAGLVDWQDGHGGWRGWRCDHCRITWTPDGTGGTQT